MALVPWWSRGDWDVAAEALGMSLPALVEHPHGHYWRLQGLIKARGDAERRRQADRAAQQQQ